MRRAILMSVAAGLLVSPGLHGQVGRDRVDPSTGLVAVRVEGSDRPLAYGTISQTLYMIPASGCSPVGGTLLDSDINGYRYRTGGSGFVDCPLNLPSGARVQYVQAAVYDASDTAGVLVSFGVCTTLDVSFACNGYGTTTSTGTAGTPFTGYIGSDISGAGIVIDKNSTFYYVRVVLQENGTNTRFRQVNVFYRLQISTPPPGTQTFDDVSPTNPYYRAIEALAASGITGGCGSGNFCPGGNVSRGEMAAFLARALGLHFPN